jgi:hypothetical protein
MNDTSPEMERKMMEMIMTKSPIERVMMGCSMYETSKQLIIEGILRQNPGISKVKLRQEIFLRFYRDDFTPSQRDKILEHLERTTR